jgi:hypothetical protein
MFGRGPGATLIPIDLKLIVILSIEHGLAAFSMAANVSFFMAPTSVFALAAANLTMAHASTKPG